MRRVSLILFIAFELLFYLLIVQTGIVEYYDSNLLLIAPLPIGGIIGSLYVHKIPLKNIDKITAFLIIQLLVSVTYPHVTLPLLLVLGVSSGALAVLMIHELKKANMLDIGLALGVSYMFGTLLFNYSVADRGWIALSLTSFILLASRFLPKEALNLAYKEGHSLVVMVSWIFLDSALFETLSRDAFIPIWRGGFSFEIVVFHLVGVILALSVKMENRNREYFVYSMFGLSYLLFFMQETTLLSIIYPIVISYYNVLILQTLRKKELNIIGLYMVFTAWLASGAGLFVALSGSITIVPALYLVYALWSMNQKTTQIQEIKNV
jgi:hypothetical protein